VVEPSIGTEVDRMAAAALPDDDLSSPDGDEARESSSPLLDDGLHGGRMARGLAQSPPYPH
jgi:hypothetical protein